MSYIELCIDDLHQWELKVVTFLREWLPEAEIEVYLNQYREDPITFFDQPQNQGISPGLLQAVAGLSIIRKLLEQTEKSIPDNVSTEEAARFSFYSFQAGLLIGMSLPGHAAEFTAWKEMVARRAAEAAKSETQELRLRPKRAAVARHKPLNDFKDHAKKVARERWKDGSQLNHHKMVKYLIEEYQEDGKFPFTHLPGDPDKPSDNILREAVKAVAYELNRPELVIG